MAVTKIKPIKSTLKKALEYIQNPDKTDDKMLVSSFGCSYETADIEFAFTLSQALDKGNNLAHHLIQSFEPGEVSFEKAHEIGKQLADAVTKEAITESEISTTVYAMKTDCRLSLRKKDEKEKAILSIRQQRKVQAGKEN